jgi:hypothetical protein
MTSHRPLTARGLKAILTRAGVDHSALTITDDPTVWTDVESGERTAQVKVAGPKDVRRAVFQELFPRGYAQAPYLEADYWSRTR